MVSRYIISCTVYLVVDEMCVVAVRGVEEVLPLQGILACLHLLP
jgi:hypothetical protein